MNPALREQRRREMEQLQARIRENPQRDWSEERYRVGVLATQIAAQDRLEHA